jgi:hypothetical protein
VCAGSLAFAHDILHNRSRDPITIDDCDHRPHLKIASGFEGVDAHLRSGGALRLHLEKDDIPAYMPVTVDPRAVVWRRTESLEQVFFVCRWVHRYVFPAMFRDSPA